MGFAAPEDDQRRRCDDGEIVKPVHDHRRARAATKRAHDRQADGKRQQYQRPRARPCQLATQQGLGRMGEKKQET